MLWRAEDFAISRSSGVNQACVLQGRSTFEKIWRFHLTCAFMELLASYDNANYASYLLNFFPARYKACKSMWKFSQPSHKKLRCVYARSYVYMWTSKVKYSLWALVFRKVRWLIRPRCLIKSKISDKFEKFLACGDIILNCLIPGEGVNDIFEVTISNANNSRVSSLADEIRNRRLDRFQDIDSTSLALYKVGFIADSVIIQTLRNNNVFIVEGSVEMTTRHYFYHFPHSLNVSIPVKRESMLSCILLLKRY